MGFPINRSNFRLHRGLSNPIQVLIRDIDRAPVTFADGIVPVVTIVHRETFQVLFQSALTLVDSTQSLWTFSVGPTDLTDWSISDCTYTITTQDADGALSALYIDRGYNFDGEVEIFDGPFPPSISSTVLPASSFLSRNGTLFCGAIAGAAQVNNLSGLHSLAVYGEGLTASITAQALLDASPGASDDMWLPIATFTVTDLAAVQSFNFEGNFVWIRYAVTVSAGTLTQILSRS